MGRHSRDQKPIALVGLQACGGFRIDTGRFVDRAVSQGGFAERSATVIGMV